MEGEHKKPEITAINPKGTVPFITIKNGDKTELMIETVAIMRFLANTFPDKAGKFYPGDAMQKYHVDKWCDFYTDSFRPAFIRQIGAMFVLIMEKRPADDRDRFVIEKAKVMQKNALTKLNDLLATQDFICGSDITMADFVIYCEMQDVRYLGNNFDEYPNLVKYQENCLKASGGLEAIHKTGGDWDTKIVPMAAGMFKLD